jgi:hypothetical protein
MRGRVFASDDISETAAVMVVVALVAGFGAAALVD